MGKLHKTFALLKTARRAYDQAIRDELPPGKRITWLVTRNGNLYKQHGECIQTVFDRVQVRNTRTGKEYWIEVATLLLSHLEILP